MIKKHLSIVMILLLFITCDKSKELQGRWIEVDEYSSPLILEFNGDTLIWCRPDYGEDTVAYSIKDTNLILTSKIDTQIMPFKILDDNLFYGSFHLRRTKKNWFINDIINSLDTKINLPNGIGEKLKCFELYFIKLSKNDKITIWNEGNRIASDIELYNCILSKRNFHESCRIGHTLFADKEIPYHHISNIKKVLRYSNGLKIYYATISDDDSSYNDLYGISSKLPPIFDNELEHIPDTFRKSLQMRALSPNPLQSKKLSLRNSPIISLYPDSIVWNNEKVTETQFQEKLSLFVQNYKKKTAILCFIDGHVKYGRYVWFIDKTYNSFYMERNKIATEEYDKEFNDLPDSIQKIIKRRLPRAVWEITKKEFDELE